MKHSRRNCSCQKAAVPACWHWQGLPLLHCLSRSIVDSAKIRQKGLKKSAPCGALFIGSQLALRRVRDSIMSPAAMATTLSAAQAVVPAAL